MGFVKNWELFYTDAKGTSTEDDLVDQVEIDVVNKRYDFYEDASYLVTDGYCDDGEPIESTYVSREVFDMLLDALKRNGYKAEIFDGEEDTP